MASAFTFVSAAALGVFALSPVFALEASAAPAPQVIGSVHAGGDNNGSSDGSGSSGNNNGSGSQNNGSGNAGSSGAGDNHGHNR